ncbi:hypothetical protein [Chryseobacterium echinoideorum]|uniref:hypothetical protein n=1 Tax=Chryseobacterium echinoideorum TaxID=1549648 RepID=UPI0011866C6A|nr:hypothetical protein [Chryseobacterium echinoideorum]
MWLSKKTIVFCLIFLFEIFFSQNKLIPILAFHGVPQGEYSTKEHFLNMKNVGIDICYNSYNNSFEALKALDAAQQAGVKIVVRVPTLFTDTENTVKLFKKHPALYGYYIFDEPSPKEFDKLKILIDTISKYDSKHIFYINLFPNYVGKDVIRNYTYKQYLEAFISKVNPSYISFDYYPIANNNVRKGWYSNLEDIRDISKINNIPFWAFACSTIHFNYLAPTTEGIKLQQFSNLLYGAQSLQYFTYWTNTFEYIWIKDKYGNGIVDDKGMPTATYDIVKNVNQQIQRLAWVFVGAKSDQVFHIGNQIPEGTFKLPSLPKGFSFFSTNGKDALISYMSNGKNNFIIVQNKSLEKKLKLEYKLRLKMKKVNNNTGKTESQVIGKKSVDYILPGDILIFSLN